MPGKKQFLFIGIVRITHGSRGHDSSLYLAAQIVPDDPKRVLLSHDLVKFLDSIALGAAVAVDAAMAAALIDIHIIISAKPFPGLLHPCHDGLGGNIFYHRLISFPNDSKET